MDKIEIPFGAYDSETLGWTYTIPKGYTAKIEDGKIVVKKEELEDEKIRKSLVKFLKSLPIKHRCEYAASELENWLSWLEKQKEQKVDIDKLRRDIYQSGYNDGYQHGKEDAQKEQKPAIKLVFPRFRVGDIICNVHDECDKTTKRISYVGEHGYNFDYRHLGDKAGGGSFGFCYEDYYELVEQKPVGWSEEDESQLNDIEKAISNYYDLNHAPQYHYWLEQKLKSLRSQSKQEWGEEDGNNLNRIATILVKASYVQNWWSKGRLISKDEMEKLTDWLKSLRPPLKDKEMKLKILKYLSTRCSSLEFEEVEDYLNNLRPSWKPSEEQMEALEEVRTIFHHHHLWDEINPILYDYEELMRDLQKLP